MQVQCKETSDGLLVTIDGQLDDTSASSLPSRLSMLCEGKNQVNIMIDLAACRVDSCLGYGALVAFRLSPSVLGKQVSICNALPDVASGMRALRFEKLFKLI